MNDVTEKENVAPLNPPVTPTLPPVADTTEKEEKQEVKSPVHPLEPGGVRFQQIYARAKSAEQELDEERERRIRAEAERDLLKTASSQPATQQTEREYTNAELEAMMIQGQATKEQVDDYKEKRLEARLEAKLRGKLADQQKEEQRAVRLASDFSEYIVAIPDINVQGTEARKAVDAEFDYLVGIHGIDTKKLSATDRQSLALNAVRNVYGPVTSLRQRTSPPTGEPHRGSIGGERPISKPNPDQALLDGLKPEQVEHYSKMMRAGRYPNGWSDVVEELKYTPPTLKSGVVRR